VQGGDIDAFEVLLARHSRRVHRTLLAILGNADDAEDAMQETFLKAFQHIAEFQRRAKFSTWLTKIASNTALQRLRDRVPTESIDEESD
jgi:RNA polymerase sigma-70 factor (ECF subfamily)